MLTALTPHRHPARYIGLFFYRYEPLADIALTLLGPPTVSLGGSPLKGMESGKGLALLVYLSLEPGRHSREELAALLWGDTPDHAARASLRQALKRLRAVLGDVILIDGTNVTLGPGPTCDVIEFLDAADTRPEEAARFDVPRFLAGFSPRHARAFEEWVATKRQHLLQRYRHILAGLARDAMNRSHWRKALTWTDTWLASDPFSEEATRLAIEALYLAGDRGAALERFAEYRERLAHENGRGPGTELLDLGRRIAADQTTGRILEDPGPSQVPAFETRLVGREEQWRQLGETWAAIQRGTGQVVLVEGEPGVGKTRLVEEFLRWATAKGATAVRGRGYDAKLGIPFGPVVEMLRAALGAQGLGGAAPEWLAEVALLLPELRQRFPGLPDPAPASDTNGERRLYEGVAQVALALAAERPTVLFIDDLQWCDAKTCALLHFLARRLSGARVALVAGVTLGELERDAPAIRLRRALRSESHTVVVTPSPLTEDDVWQMVHEMGRLRSPSGGRRFAARLREITDGNPFHLVELIKTLFAEGLLALDSDTGEWTAPNDGGPGGMQALLMPRTVHAVIRERVTSLPYELRDLLATIAVAGRGVKTDLLSHVHGMSRLRAAALSDGLVERRLLIQEPGVYRAHPVVGEVVRESLTPARRAEVHRAIALSLETTTAPERIDEVAGEIARHAARGGERAMAYRFAVLGSDAATRQYAYEDALSWLDLAASVAQEGGETEKVNRLTAEVLRLAGWTEPRRAPRRPGTPARGIGRADIDLAGTRDEGQSRV